MRSYKILVISAFVGGVALPMQEKSEFVLSQSKRVNASYDSEILNDAIKERKQPSQSENEALLDYIGKNAKNVQTLALKGRKLKPENYESVISMVNNTKNIQYLDLTDNPDLAKGDIIQFSKRLRSPYLKGVSIDPIKNNEQQRQWNFLNSLRYKGDGFDVIQNCIDKEGSLKDILKSSSGSSVVSQMSTFGMKQTDMQRIFKKEE